MVSMGQGCRGYLGWITKLQTLEMEVGMFKAKIISVLSLLLALFIFTGVGYATPVTEDTQHSEWDEGITHFPGGDHSAPVNDKGSMSKHGTPDTEDTQHSDWDIGITRF